MKTRLLALAIASALFSAACSGSSGESVASAHSDEGATGLALTEEPTAEPVPTEAPTA